MINQRFGQGVSNLSTVAELRTFDGTDVLIVGRLDVHGQSFAPIGLHKIDDASNW
jgi:hypothetical protein